MQETEPVHRTQAVAVLQLLEPLWLDWDPHTGHVLPLSALFHIVFVAQRHMLYLQYVDLTTLQYVKGVGFKLGPSMCESLQYCMLWLQFPIAVHKHASQLYCEVKAFSGNFVACVLHTYETTWAECSDAGCTAVHQVRSITCHGWCTSPISTAFCKTTEFFTRHLQRNCSRACLTTPTDG